jgi:predicted permease
MKQWWNWKRQDRDLEKEMRHHLRMAETERMERGASTGDARAAALREFGNASLVKELARDAWGWRWIQDLSEDLRYGLRTLRKQLGFSTIAIVTLGLGIGANTAIFSLIDAALLRALPVRGSQQLVSLQWTAKNPPQHLNTWGYGDCEISETKTNPYGCSLSEPFFRDIAKRDIFAKVAAFGGASRLNLSGAGTAASVVDRPEYVSGEYFNTLGIQPALGRLFSAEDDGPSAADAVVLSYRFWRTRFGGSPEVLGKTILLNRLPFTVVGVAEEAFDALSPGNLLDMWLPLSSAARLEVPWENRDIDPSFWRLVIVGRLKPDAAPQSAAAQLTARFEYFNILGHRGMPIFKPEDRAAIVLQPIERGLTGDRRDASSPLYLMMLVVGIVLLIACANVAGLMLARATSRQKEMAVRFALGASKGRILRQLLTESLMVSCAGGALGVLLAAWCLAGIVRFLQTNQEGPLPFMPAIDTRVLLFTAAVTLLTGVFFGLAPALRGLRVDLTPALKEGAGASGESSRPKHGWFSAGNALVIAQVALSIVVLAGAGLLVRTLQNLKNIYPGFDTRNVLTFTMDPTLIGYKTTDADHLYASLQTRLGAMPGVLAVSYSWLPLLGGGRWGTTFPLEGHPKDEEVSSDVMPIGPAFFSTMRIPLLAGHEFDAGDFARSELIAAARDKRREQQAAALKSGAAGAPKASEEELPPMPVIVNQTFIRRYLPQGNPIGRIFGTNPGDPSKDEDKSAGWQIAGVVANAKYDKLRREIEPTMYIPNAGGAVSFALRTESNPNAFVPQVRAMVSQLDANLPIFEVRTETRQIEQQIFKERLVARLAGFFGALALLLACIGLYGLISYEVARRTREIGIRSALGAARSDVLRLVLVQGMRLVAVGSVLGVGLALVVNRYAEKQLFKVKAADPLTLVGVVLLLLAVTLLACFVPARRAMRVDPVIALRYE